MLTTTEPTAITLPPIPVALKNREVAGWEESVLIDTYEPGDPSEFPAYLNSRVYQGSSGRVFPLPYHERINPTSYPRSWRAVHLENEWIRLMILPELGGRIHIAYDKIARCDIFYRNNVIKPALVGLAGPWISGGIEFNWPQHHRPATFLPTDIEIEEEDDGSVTVWCSDHDPFSRMKGMHGIRLRPDSSAIEARVRLYNRGELAQSFLWWANVAVPVGDNYQSFFPGDVRYVADHARRAMCAFPVADRSYYGIDYPSRATREHPDADRLDWYRNIPVPTSYMALDSDQEFFGGYDHGRDAGFVHWAPREISPGKKHWTWGDSPFGHAWDRNLTDDDGPYVELMAGVYTDNQPDFAWLRPGETKSFSQYWYPIRSTGPATLASKALAIAVERLAGTVTLRFASNLVAPGTRLLVATDHGVPIVDIELDLHPSRTEELMVEDPGGALRIVASGAAGLLFDDVHRPIAVQTDEPAPAVEPPQPRSVGSVDELFTIGSYLNQYRHATRSADDYWLEGLRRDPHDVRCNTALGERALRRGNYQEAERFLRAAVSRQTEWVRTPTSGEAHYLLGLAFVHLGRDDDARYFLSRAGWDAAWTAPSWFALAKVLCRLGDTNRAAELLAEVVAHSPRHSQARNLLALFLRQSGDERGARALLDETLRNDPLDHAARLVAGLSTSTDASTYIDVALEFFEAAQVEPALHALEAAASAASTVTRGEVNVKPLIDYHRARVLRASGRPAEAEEALATARMQPLRWAAAARLHDVRALEDAPADDAGAALLLGNWYFSQSRHEDAMMSWQRAIDSTRDTWIRTVAHRNLGLASYNILRDSRRATEHYDQARELSPTAALLSEYDQLMSRLGDPEPKRLQRLERDRALVAERDDLVVTLASLLSRTGRALEGRQLLRSRVFQPWEGGEGRALGAWDEAALAIARTALSRSDARQALDAIEMALNPPVTLGEARHPLANTAELHLVLGDAFFLAGDLDSAANSWHVAAEFIGDFVGMAPRPYSGQTLWSIAALRRLARPDDSNRLTKSLNEWIEQELQSPAEVDFFATSQPTMLLFIDEPKVGRDQELNRIKRELATIDL